MVIEDLCRWTVEMTSRRLQRSQLLRDSDTTDDLSCPIRIAVPENSRLTRDGKSLTYGVVILFPPRMDNTGIDAKYKDLFR